MRNSWTDERLDDGFEHVRSDIAVVRQEVGQVRGEVGQLRTDMSGEFKSVREEMNEGFKAVREEMHQGFAAQNRLLLQLAGGIVVALIGVIATLAGLTLTQL